MKNVFSKTHIYLQSNEVLKCCLIWVAALKELRESGFLCSLFLSMMLIADECQTVRQPVPSYLREHFINAVH